jgi:Tol biopolymer transport system component
LTGAQADGASYYPAISANGRYVAFQSLATNLVSGDTNGKMDVFLRDRTTGITSRVSVSSSGAQGNGDSRGASITADGRLVAFSTSALNVVPNQTTGTFCVHDRLSGSTTCVCVDLNGNPANGGGIISGNGRVVVFISGASNLVAAGGNGFTQMYSRNLSTGVTTCLSVNAAGAFGNQISSYHAISYDGRFIAFGSQASNLVPNDTNGVKDVFVSDLRLGTLTRVSVNAQSVQANGWCSTPAISASGRYVAGYSEGTNLVHGDTNGETDVFMRSLW